MNIRLQNLKPTYMSEAEIGSSDIYLCPDVDFRGGEKTLIKARSGKGKSSVLNFIYGTNSRYTGQILFDDETLSDKKIFDLRQSVLSYVFQDFKLFDELTVRENIEIKNQITDYKTDTEIADLIQQVHLANHANRLVSTLSLGQRQRVAIIRALCQPFAFLLLDEPFSHLDDENIEILTRIITEELQKQNAGLILTTLGNEYLFDYDTILNL